jgi:dynein heavy chain
MYLVASNPMFVSNEMKNINMAAKSLCEWVHAVNNFTDIYKEITNKKENCRVMDIELSKAN